MLGLLSGICTLGFAPERSPSRAPRKRGACRWRVRLPSLVLFVVGVVLERWDLAGEQTPVLGIPIDGCE